MSRGQLCRMACFILVAAVLISGLSWLLRDRQTTLAALYSEQDNTVDVLIVGSSHVNSGYMPGLLWQEYGISACNAFSWSQPMWVSYHYIVESLKTQSPSVVVVDLNGMLYGNSLEQPQETDRTSYINSFNIDPGLNFLRLINTVEDCGIDLRDAADFLPLAKYHTRWKNLNETAFTYDPHNDYDFLHGWGFLSVVQPQPAPAYAPAQQPLTPFGTAIEYLDKTIELSKKEGFELVFVLAPLTCVGNEPGIFLWLEEYLAQQDIPFLNYCTPEGSQAIGLNWQTDFADNSHVNWLGAQKLTRDLGRFLQQNYTLRTRRQIASAQQLDRDSLQMRRVIDIWEYTQAGDEAFLHWAAENGQLALAVSGGPEQLDPQLLEQLVAVGFDGLAAWQQDASYAAVVAGGDVQQQGDFAGAACTVQGQAGVYAVSRGAVTQGAGVGIGSYSQQGAVLQMLYYDPVLSRPVYRITLGEDGALVYTDLGADLVY